MQSSDLAKNPEALYSNQVLKEFSNFLTGHFNGNSPGVTFDFRRLLRDIRQGLFLHSTIPVNYGLGSSGALCAALFESYGKQTQRVARDSLRKMQAMFAHMESYFHGSSSGVDPLSIYLGKPLAIRRDEYIIKEINEVPDIKGMTVFLIDTGMSSQTGPLVNHFRERMKSVKYRTGFLKDYIPLVNQAVDQWVEGNMDEQVLLEISRQQKNFFDVMIPEAASEIWEYGIKSRLYACKLCGAGGGGMLLGFTSRFSETQAYLWSRHRVNVELL